MTEKQREYHKRWNKEHPEKVREYRRNSAIRSAIRDILENGAPPVNITMTREELDQIGRCVYWLKDAPGSPKYMNGGGMDWVYDYVDMNTMRTINHVLQSILLRANIDWRSYKWDVVEDYKRKKVVKKRKAE